ncbi:hypothetical protein ASG43_13470 [Aureimonas sp. Leaf454]|uniref:hypothetical protein n=1 Tax=Aureimonas sp. Leaf454 TaxID=1736381 RepID=UPI000700676A|nr:hypothetical protein [Aureimonas sp. Leaf454]KQT44360.1 hypothetical protein ASG43_13470 [Aureimonas sp. Leaf454]
MAARSAFAWTPEPRVLAFPHCPTFERLGAAPRLSEAERGDLDRLRWLFLKSRLAPKPDLDKACFLLAGGEGASVERYGFAFFGGLGVHGLREMSFYRPGAKGASEDEIWLMRLVSCWRRGEEKAAAALVAWRVAEPGRRWMRFLSAGMVRLLDTSPEQGTTSGRSDAL